MRKTKLIALTAAATVVMAVPFAAPAGAAESHPCDAFADPYSRICMLPIRVYCLVFPDQTICP